MAFNLFDFSTSVGAGNFTPQASPTQIGGVTGGGQMPPTTTAKPLTQTPIVRKTIQATPAPSFMEKAVNTIVPKASASMSEKDMQDLIDAGASDEEILQVAQEMEKQIASIQPKQETPKVEPTKLEEQGFISKTFEGLKSAPEAAFTGLSGLLTGGVKSLIGDDKFKKEGETGNLGEVVGKQESALTNTLKTTKGITGTAFLAAAPGISTTLAGVGATEYGGQALGAIGDVLHFVGQTVLNQIPVLKEMTTEQKNDFTDSLANAFGTKSAAGIKVSPANIFKKGEPVISKGIGGNRGIIEKLSIHPGTTLKNFGAGIINFLYETEASTAKAGQKYLAGLSPKSPITIGDVAGEFNIAGGTKQMGADAMVAKTKLWKNEIAPKIENTHTVISGETLLKGIREDFLNSEKPPSSGQIADFNKAFTKLEEAYKGKQFSAKELAREKSALQEVTLDISPTSAFRKQIMGEIAKNARNNLIEIVKKDTGKDITDSMFKYGALRTLQDMGERAAMSPEQLKVAGRTNVHGTTISLVDALSGLISPIKNIAGGVLYRLGNGLEFIGPKGITGITDILRNSDKVKIQNPQVLMNILEQKTTAPIKAPIKPTPAAPGTLYTKPVPKPKQTPPAPKGPIVNVKKYARGEVADLPRVEVPKGEALYGKGKAPIRKPIAPKKSF